MQPPDVSPQQVFVQLNKAFQRTATAHTAPTVYLIMVITGFSSEEILGTLPLVLPLLILVSVVGPFLLMRRMVFQALTRQPGELDGARLKRILELPQSCELGLIGLTTLGVAIYTIAPVIHYGKNPLLIPWAIVTVVLLGALSGIHTRVSFERLLRPLAIQEFQRNPVAVLNGSGFLWPRYQWYLPFALGLFIVCALLMSFTVVGREAYGLYTQALLQVDAAPQGQVSQILRAAVAELFKGSIIPLVLLNGYLLVAAAISAVSLARQLSEGTRSVQVSMEALAAGAPRLPEWCSTDELGELASATARAFSKLRDFSFSLRDSAGSLKRSADQLGLSTTKQTEVLTLQASALQETQVTAQEIKETSAMATQKAEIVLKQTDRANEISQEGEAAVARSLEGLKEIQAQVREMASRIRALDERARQIGKITESVKQLADRSNMLAINAAIESVRSGEHGKGFGVVAREIRSLADQSIKATTNVRDILEDISEAISSTAAMTEAGSEKVESSLGQIREFGETLQQLTSIVRDNAQAVRQITTAVGQQSTGITQIFQAVNDLSTMMDQTMSQLNTSMGSVDLVRNVSEQVASFLGSYGWSESQSRSGNKLAS
ncbi:methyl-accepting chemotaxis protein [Archangium violaceum]|uniref:methyl-accepting chemotaxis protein n=1 Tax=Archangium violaceum TaxID=83451 RepID=UPI001951B525|nr:methyl-accepting chemotaxis protein [Archangium violaceum]QRN94405.1 methyl-accepting chemotaxis protein [Archangium violaceum]